MVDRRRDHGGRGFLDLRDACGNDSVQPTGLSKSSSDPQHTPGSYQRANALRNEYVVQITDGDAASEKESLIPLWV